MKSKLTRAKKQPAAAVNAEGGGKGGMSFAA